MLFLLLASAFQYRSNVRGLVCLCLSHFLQFLSFLVFSGCHSDHPEDKTFTVFKSLCGCVPERHMCVRVHQCIRAQAD